VDMRVGILVAVIRNGSDDGPTRPSSCPDWTMRFGLLVTSIGSWRGCPGDTTVVLYIS
jgi:hypothetical protein